MNKQILLGHIDAFELGFLYGKQGQNWTRRMAAEKIGFRNQEDEDRFIQGMIDGLADDRWRLRY